MFTSGAANASSTRLDDYENYQQQRKFDPVTRMMYNWDPARNAQQELEI